MDGLQSTIKLNNGVEMPRLGLGVWKTSNNDSRDAVITAIKHGYRAIDTAREYGKDPVPGEVIGKGWNRPG